MYFVYIIQSKKNKVLYFGRTKDIDKRLADHNSGSNFSTKDNCPWEYVYLEGYKSEKDAIDRELKLKNYGNARTYVKKRIKNSLL
ncbi:MAG: GIY-YIG nuclease family protein [bacterium]|nr:GIY-YIG nuclease family protein [bacterium]